MRQQIAAANWKMNLDYKQAKTLLDTILAQQIMLEAHRKVVFAVPFPYLRMARKKTKEMVNYEVSAQNCYQKKSGAFTGEVSVEMIHSSGARYVIIGHSERREYFHESDQVLAEKINLALEHRLTPIFCCGEALSIRESGKQDAYVAEQLANSLFHLTPDAMQKIVIAYEPIWAIGTGKTATAAQAQEMHAGLRSVLARQFGQPVADLIPILYGGSVKGSNAKELFSQPDVDGGLVGGASLIAEDFTAIIHALK
ncbi:MAG: triose-phosphate isomerase [Chitinophagaceae bacterium]|nr:triose-phosphate isomerase [Chitinophagaceae bacterium]